MVIIQGHGLPVTFLIAMQKVVGSNPINRFFANPLHVGGSGSAWVAATNRTIPAYRRYSRH